MQQAVIVREFQFDDDSVPENMLLTLDELIESYHPIHNEGWLVSLLGELKYQGQCDASDGSTLEKFRVLEGQQDAFDNQLHAVQLRLDDSAWQKVWSKLSTI